MGIDADAWKNAFKIYRGGISADRDAKNFRTGMNRPTGDSVQCNWIFTLCVSAPAIYIGFYAFLR